MNILIVEDHYSSARAMSLMLERKFNIEKKTTKCYIANTLAQGLEMSQNPKMDITIVDLSLPGSTVDQVIESIPFFSHPVIIITSLDDPDSALEIKCYEHCAQNFFPKHVLRTEIYEHKGITLVDAITKAHWRDRLPKLREERLSNGNV